MRRVIDSNCLQSQVLRHYLAASPQNYAVLTDYAAIEAFKGDPRIIYHSMEILAEHPHKVVILKGTQEVCGLGPFDAAPPDGLIDFDQTHGFAMFCERLAEAKRGNRFVQAQLGQSHREAVAHMGRILTDMPQLNLGIELIAATYSTEELKILRRREPFTRRMGDRVVEQVMILAAELFGNHPQVREVPRGPEVRNTFIFRHAVCFYVLALQAIENGAAGRAKPRKLRNDCVDLNFATFATFFDGLMSADKKAQGIYAQATFFLREIFAMPMAPGL